MANTLLTPTIITREALRILHQKLRFISTIDRQYDSRFARRGAKIGNNLQIRLPNQFSVRTGKTIDTQDIDENSVTLTVATQKGIDWLFSSEEMTMHIDDYSKRYLDPAMSRLAAQMESDALAMFKDVPREVSDIGATMSNADVLAGSKILTQQLCPDDGRCLLLHPTDNESLVNANTGLFNPQGNISGAFREGMVQNRFFGYEKVLESSLMPTHTSGSETANTWRTDIAAAEADGTSTNPEDGGSLHIDTGTTTLLDGDIIEIEDVFDVHPESKVSTGLLKRFVVTSDFTGGAEGDLSIYPAIVASGAKQNVNAAAADGKIIYKRESDRSTAVGASADWTISLGYHKEAFAFATADLEIPRGTHMASRQVQEGISMRFIADYDVTNDDFIARLDVLYGFLATRPELAVRYGFN